jgi:hypothetical protein
MYVVFITDLMSTLLLFWAFYAVWKERNHFFSLKPILPAVLFLIVGRICDTALEHPSLRLSHIFGLSPESFEIVFSLIGNVTDVLGIAFLIFGFITIIKYEREKEKQIHDLETLLPICANCKKYRTEDNQWMPIEKYLIESGAAKLTHGICPECTTKLYGDILKP